MDKDAIAFLDDETVEEPEVTEEVEAEAPPQEEPQPEPSAEVEVEAEAEQTGETKSEPPSPESDPQQTAPITALLDEREKRQEAQRRAEEADRKMRELQAELQSFKQPKVEAPDWFEDPQAAARHQAQTVEQQFQHRMMQQSRFWAEREFGADEVNAAVAYFDQHPEQSQQFQSHPSPFHAAVEFYKRQQVVAEVGSDPEAFRQKLREEIRAELEAEYKNAAPVQSRPKAPPPSIASAPSQGGETASPGNAFDVLFPG